MTGSALGEVYRSCIACQNARHWANLHRFVDNEIRHNGERIGLSGYRAMLERDVDAIPDLRFWSSSRPASPAVCVSIARRREGFSAST